MQSNNEGELDIIISNVVATFSTRCCLNLHTIASEGNNVIYKPKQGVRNPPLVDTQVEKSQHLIFIYLFDYFQTVTMELRKPRITANIWSSGKILCTGASRWAEKYEIWQVSLFYCWLCVSDCEILLFLFLLLQFSDDEAKIGARRIARCLQKLGFPVRI